MNHLNKNNLENDRSLATISEITRYNLVPLDLLKTYSLVNLNGSSQNSLFNCLKSLVDRSQSETQQDSPVETNPQTVNEYVNSWSRATGINVVIWSSNQSPQIKLYSAKNPVEIDRPSLMIFRNKYGQYFPIKSHASKSSLYYLGPENPQKQSSYLLLKLLNRYLLDNKL